jgi:hypothetical protein
MRTKKQIKAYNQKYTKEHRAEIRAYAAKYIREYYAVRKKKFKKYNAEYYAANQKRVKKQQTKLRRTRPELETIRSHYYRIFYTKAENHRNYKGMPFFDNWNPKKGGSFDAGAEWIINVLGRRPKGTTLHIVDHATGFVPGNLEWTHPRKQVNQQMYKIIAQQRNKIKKLEERIKELEERA